MFKLLMGFASLSIALTPTWGANLGGPSPAGSDLDKAKTQIEQKDWSASIAKLEKYVKANPNDAVWGPNA